MFSNTGGTIVGVDLKGDKPIYYQPKGELETVTGKNIIPLYIPTERFVHLILGTQGFGKSTLAGKVSKKLHQLAGVPVFQINPSEKVDPAYRGCGVKSLEPSSLIASVSSGQEQFKAEMKRWRLRKLRLKHLRPDIEPEEYNRLELELEASKPDASDYTIESHLEYTETGNEVIDSGGVLIFEDADSLKKNRNCGLLAKQAIMLDRKRGINVIMILHSPSRDSTLTSHINECDIISMFSMEAPTYNFLKNNWGSGVAQRARNLLLEQKSEGVARPFVSFIPKLMVYICPTRVTT